MSDNDDEFDPQEHQGCYVFAPTNEEQSPRKRRRISARAKEDSQEQVNRQLGLNFSVLLNGKEKESAAKLRQEAFQRFWSEEEAVIRATLDSFNQQTLVDVSQFVESAAPERNDNKIPTALVLTGPNIASHAPLFAQFSVRLRDVDKAGPVVILTSKDVTNLKGVLKKLIKDATERSNADDDDEDDEQVVGKKGTKYLNYDLQSLQNWCASHEGQKVIVAIQDTEAFDTAILADLISLFSAYLDRIPFVLLLGIATSLDIFHEKLPKSVIRMMQGDKFDVERADECLAAVFNNVVIGNGDTMKPILQLGPSLSNFLLERQQNQTQSIQAFIAAIKYAYMAHFYANPLSIILAFVDEEPEALTEHLSTEHVEAIRNLPSFRRFVESKLEESDTTEVRELLSNDEYLCSLVCTAAGECRAYTYRLSKALHALDVARSCLVSQNHIPRHDLYTKALNGELENGPVVRDLLLSIKKMNSASLLTLITALLETPSLEEVGSFLAPLRDEIEAMVEASTTGEAKKPKSLTSEFDVKSSNANALRTTAVSKKIQIDVHKAGLTKQDTEYSKLVQQVHDEIEGYLASGLKGLEDVVLHEVFFYDLLSPHRDVFAPRSRATVERALSQPNDYLACECCNIDDEGVDPANPEESMKATQPPTSVLYQLYLESGTLINAFDLWSAFYSVLGGEDGEECDEATAQALFYRSVAELRFMGFVKSTKKRVDHLQKLAWKGL